MNHTPTAGDYLTKVLPKGDVFGQEHRYKFALVVGGPGMGKSTLLLTQLIQPSMLPVLIFATKPQKWMEHLKGIESEQLRHWELALRQASSKGAVPVIRGYDSEANPECFMENLISLADGRGLNCTVVLEDCTNYVQHKASQRFQRLVNQREHFRCNVVMTYHSLQSIPRELFQYADYLILFKTGSSRKHLQSLDKIPNAETVLAAFDMVEAHPNKHFYVPLNFQR